MAESKESVQCVVFETSKEAREHGKGGIWYVWKEDSQRRFPRDVVSVYIVMPIDWDEPDVEQKGLSCEWTVDRKNYYGAAWSLSGTREKPTLYPSLHWVGQWHGWLQDGFLKSC